ncbi:MAG: response regulator [Chloroflexota bacterium]|nr:response regulator [Chloroflexota bacterium]
MTKHILVVNDTQEILELFRQILEEDGPYKVTLSSYRPQILDQVKELMPDLIISDHVFGEDKIGWQFIQRLKMDRVTATIPIIVCSGAVKELREMEGYLMSKSIGILLKPFDIDELLALVEKQLSGLTVPVDSRGTVRDASHAATQNTSRRQK